MSYQHPASSENTGIVAVDAYRNFRPETYHGSGRGSSIVTVSFYHWLFVRNFLELTIGNLPFSYLHASTSRESPLTVLCRIGPIAQSSRWIQPTFPHG